jgi:group II intron reverse transcriptase/maturase
MDDITKIQRYFARKAQAQPDYQFKDLYSLVWKADFLDLALTRVLANRGSRSAGIDGITLTHFDDPKYRTEFIQDLSHSLRTKTFSPAPGRRVYIPKDKTHKRPLGILTIKDRVVQMSLKMLLEPVFEADFLNCSYGFRPGRRTMDCIVPIWRYTNSQSKHFWVVEGDIRACFDAVNHRILEGLLHQRIADKHVLNLIHAFLQAGVMEGQLFQRTDIGTQQGGILSPLLANVYLHQFDWWWWNTYGCLTKNDRRQRRRQGLGHPILLRYADDWILLWNGHKADAHHLKAEAQTFLEQELKLELNQSKTFVTHLDDGVTFLGFDIRRYQGRHGKPIVLIKPSQKNITKFKTKIKALTQRSTSNDPVWYKIIQLNQILRGWSAYYQYVNAKTTFNKLDWWVLNRIFIWARKKHGRPPWRVITAKYKHRDPKGRLNFVYYLEDGSPLWLYRMSDRPILRYRVDWQQLGYADDGITTTIADRPTDLIDPISYPAQETDQVRLLALQRDNYTCQHCQNTNPGLQVHHLIPKQQKGQDQLDNLITLCKHCHRQIHKSEMITLEPS